MYVSSELKREKRKTHLFVNESVLLKGLFGWKFIVLILQKTKQNPSKTKDFTKLASSRK